MKIILKIMTLILIISTIILSAYLILNKSQVVKKHNSLINLIINNKIYDNNIIIVKGYLQYDTALYLYLTRDHALIFDHENAVLVEALENIEKFAKSDCIDAYVMLSDALVRYDRIRDKPILYPNKIYNIEENKTCE